MTTQAIRSRSGIPAQRAYNMQAKAKSRIGDVFGAARCFYLTSEQITERTVAIVAEVAARNAPSYVLTYLRGYTDAKREELYRYHIAWLLWLDDRLVTSKQVDEATAREKAEGKDSASDYRSPWSRIDSDRSRHVWCDREGRPLTDKSFDAKWRDA